MTTAEEIKQYIDNNGGNYPKWYVGITSDARRRLFTEHGVKEKGDYWIFRSTPSADKAREIEAYFIDTLKTDGGPGGGDDTTTTVYAYHKEAHTNQ